MIAEMLCCVVVVVFLSFTSVILFLFRKKNTQNIYRIANQTKADSVGLAGAKYVS